MTPFVGRKRELAELRSLLAVTRRDRWSAAALVVGEPGSGKTRLLNESVVGASGVRIVRVLGFEPIQPIPLAAVADLLRELARTPGAGTQLDRLAFSGQDDQRGDALQIFEAAHRSLRSLGAVVIVIDDLQWVDEQSLGLVQYLLRAAGATRQPLAVIAASRPSRQAASLRAAIAAELPAERRAEIELAPLPRDEGMSLARHVDPGLGDARADELWQRAGGSPFWLEALARLGTGEDRSSVMDERLRALSSDAGTLLASLAVGARPFLVDEIADALGWERERLTFAAHELMTAGLAVDVSGTVRLAHDLIRESAVAELPATARRTIHARFAGWIDRTGADDLASLREALVHCDAAGLPTAGLAVRLLASPQRRLLRTDDLVLLGSIADRLPPGSSEQRHLDTGLAELAAILAEQDVALARWNRVSESSPEPADRMRAELGAARAAYRLGRSTDAHGHISRARAAGEPSVETAIHLDALEAEVHLWLEHDTAAGRRAAERALSRAHGMVATAGGLEELSTSSRSAFMSAAEAAGDAAMQEDRADELLRLGREILDAARSSDEASYLAALMRVGFSLRPLGYVDESRARFQEAWDRSHQLVMPVAMVESGHGLARSLRDIGRLAEARAIAVETAELEARIRNAPRRWGSARSILHTIELLLGDPAAALRALRDDAAVEPDPHYRLAIRQAITTWEARTRGGDRAADIMEQLAAAQADSASAGCPRCAAELAVVSVEVLARVGQVEDAWRTLEGWEQAGIGTYPQRDRWRLRALASLAAADEEPALAVSALEELCAELGRNEMLPELAWARLDLGRMLRETDRPRAVEAFTDAAALADRMGAVALARIASMELRRLGVRAWRRAASPAPAEGRDLTGLSAREREIVRLVSTGGSNREIAERLVVSPKTVERHVTNVLAKLGLRNRTELAAAANAALVRASPDE